jgi:hypothetical protein
MGEGFVSTCAYLRTSVFITIFIQGDRKGTFFAAADANALQRCVRAIEAASSGASSSPDSIASSAALTPALFDIKNTAATNAVFAVLGCDWAAVKAAGFPLKEVKAAGCDPASATSAGYDLKSLIMEFGYDTVACVGCDMKSIVLVTAPSLALFMCRPTPTPPL